jgi:hypothetical protein
MHTNAPALANVFHTTLEKALACFATLNEADLARSTAEEGWPVLFVGWHLAHALVTHRHWVGEVVAGRDIPMTMGDIDARNAAMVAQARTLTRQGVVAELRWQGTLTEQFLRGLRDADLTCSAMLLPASGSAMTAAAVIRFILIGHITTHMIHVRQCVTPRPEP